MSRTKHFPTITEYAAWVVRQPTGAVLGTAFDGVSYPYEAYLSEYYGTNVTVIAGDVYEMNGRSYSLPQAWDDFTVGYHDSDLCDAYEAANGPQSGIEVTTEIEIAYLTELLGVDAVKVPAPKKAGKSTRKTVLTDAEIAAVQLPNRQQHGEYTTFTALSRDGHTEYQTTLNGAGRCVGCTCPATVRDCIHAQAAEFEFAWSSPVAKAEQVWHDDDTTAHVEDSIRSSEFEIGEMEAIAAEIIADELVRAEIAALPDIDEIGFLPELPVREPVSMVERMRRAPMTSNDGFKLLA